MLELKNIKKSTPKDFFNVMNKSKQDLEPEHAWRVDIHSTEDYKQDKLFKTEGGSCVAIEPNGNIISVLKRPNDTSVKGKDLIKFAVDNGGDRLDAFSGLYGFYAKQGFEPVSWVEFNEEYAPEGWRKGIDAPEPVIFYKYTGKRTPLKLNEFLKSVSPSSDYDTAYEIRDRSIKNGK